MALYLAIKNHVIAMIHHTYQFLLPDHTPPRFYVLLVLISILLIILVKAGLFDEEISAINGIIFAGNSTREVIEVHRKSYKLEKIDNEDHEEEEDDDADGVDLSNNKSCAPTVWKDENYGKDQAEDIEQLHKRVEDFIRRVQMRFHIEHTTVAGIL